jgi:hypothetical protein
LRQEAAPGLQRLPIAAFDPLQPLSFCQTLLSNKQLSAFKRQVQTLVSNIGQSEAIPCPLEPMGDTPPAEFEQIYYD